jgi:hypothetical protein
MKKFAWLAATALAMAAPGPQLRAQTQAPTCFDYANCARPPKAKFNYICTNVSDRTKDPDDDSQFVYMYERTLWEMVGGRPGIDSLATVAPRVRVLWRRYHDDFVCDTAGLSMGRILAYSIHNDLIDFIKDLVQTYGVDPNVYDPSERVKGTVLDYADSELARLRRNSEGRSTAQIRELEAIRAILGDLGVKHWSEVSSSTKPYQ